MLTFYRRLVPLAAAATVLAVGLALPAQATSSTVITDPSGDADGNACGVMNNDCDPVHQSNHPAVDIVAVTVSAVSGDIAVDTAFLDVDDHIAGLGAEDTLENDVVFWPSHKLDPCQVSVELRYERDGNGAARTAEAFVSGRDGWARPPVSAAVDATANRIRLSVALVDLSKAIQTACTDARPFRIGSQMSGFMAHSQALDNVTGAFPKVTSSVAEDEGWPDAGDPVYTLG
jgi:hypothetical protein